MSYYRDIKLGLGNNPQDIQIGIGKRTPDITLNVNTGIPGNTYCKMIVKSTEQWALMPTFVPGKHDIIVYSDYYQNEDGSFSPRIKIGDGSAYVVDLPWADGYLEEQVQNVLDQFNAHIQNATVHITPEERTFWNNKLNYTIDESNEHLILNRN